MLCTFSMFWNFCKGFPGSKASCFWRFLFNFFFVWFLLVKTLVFFYSVTFLMFQPFLASVRWAAAPETNNHLIIAPRLCLSLRWHLAVILRHALPGTKQQIRAITVMIYDGETLKTNDFYSCEKGRFQRPQTLIYWFTLLFLKSCPSFTAGGLY